MANMRYNSRFLDSASRFWHVLTASHSVYPSPEPELEPPARASAVEEDADDEDDQPVGGSLQVGVAINPGAGPYRPPPVDPVWNLVVDDLNVPEIVLDLDERVFEYMPILKFDIDHEFTPRKHTLIFSTSTRS